MSIAVASLYCNGWIDVMYDIMTQKIVYEPQCTHEPCSMMQSYSKIIDVPNIHFTIFDLGSAYVILQCCRWYNGIAPLDVFGGEETDRCCILKTFKGNIKNILPVLGYKPYGWMKQITCDDLDASFLQLGREAVKKVNTTLL